MHVGAGAKRATPTSKTHSMRNLKGTLLADAASYCHHAVQACAGGENISPSVSLERGLSRHDKAQRVRLIPHLLFLPRFCAQRFLLRCLGSFAHKLLRMYVCPCFECNRSHDRLPLVTYQNGQGSLPDESCVCCLSFRPCRELCCPLLLGPLSRLLLWNPASSGKLGSVNSATFLAYVLMSFGSRFVPGVFVFG